MIRALGLIAWCLVLVLLGAYHYGPGQNQMKLDDAGRLIRTANAHVQHEKWSEAAEAFSQALEILPEDKKTVINAVRLERNKAWMNCSQLPEAHNDLVQLVEMLETDPAGDTALLRDAKQTMANSKFYLTWLMRLEGKSREQWLPHIETARQTFRELAESPSALGDIELKKSLQEDLESTIRLARLDLKQLQGLPIPSQ